MKMSYVIGISLALAAIPLTFVNAANACDDDHVHEYGTAGSFGYNSATVRSTGADDGAGGVGFVSVSDTGVIDCNQAPTGDEEDGPGDGIPGDWDGDYDFGIGGGFFGYGTHAETDVCDYDLNTGGGHVEVSDIIFGSAISFVVAENDQSGPIFVPVFDPVTNEQIDTFCDTPGGITPAVDSDDCISDADGDITNGYTSYVGSGDTCGTGGGDGGFWVFLDGVEVSDAGDVDPPTPSVPTTNNAPTAGTITRS